MINPTDMVIKRHWNAGKRWMHSLEWEWHLKVLVVAVAEVSEYMYQSFSWQSIEPKRKWINWFEFSESKMVLMPLWTPLWYPVVQGYVNNLWMDCWPVLANSEDSLNRKSAFSINLRLVPRHYLSIIVVSLPGSPPWTENLTLCHSDWVQWRTVYFSKRPEEESESTVDSFAANCSIDWMLDFLYSSPWPGNQTLDWSLLFLVHFIS